MKEVDTIDLVKRLNAINVEKQQLEIKIINLDNEYNQIVQELWDRIPSLKDDVNLQPKVPRKRL